MGSESGVVVTATRRRADGGPSARALLISVLGQWVGTGDVPVWNGTLVAALGAMGIEERAARQAINRTAADGWLEGESVGRYTRWRLSPTGQDLLGTAGRRLQRSFTTDRPWDGSFLLLVLSGPAPDRGQRERLATRLDFEGFGTLGPNVWIAADLRARAGAESLLGTLGLAGSVLSMRATAIEDGEPAADIVARAWDLERAAAAHTSFLEAFDGVEPTDDREAFALRTRLAHEWRHILTVDPALPVELLPADWVGSRARALFHRCFEQWAAAATAYFAAIADEAAAS